MSENKHVFISYSSKDVDYVLQITEVMKLNNIEFWKAPDRIPAGSNYAKEIPKAIKECGVFLLIYSSNSQNSIWVEKELDTAICHRKEVLPIRVDKTEFNDLFKFYLNNVQMLDAICKEKVIINVDVLVSKIAERLGIEKNEGTDVKDKIEVFAENRVRRIGVDKRSNALRINRIPLECEYCGGGVELKSIGVYVCEKCGRENYDDYYKIRNYIEKYGPAPAIVISRSTGVARASIEHFLSS